MIDARSLLGELKRLVRRLEDDLREVHDDSDAAAALEAEWQTARAAGRTAHTLLAFKNDALIQSAVHWVLTCIFLRFIEDNRLIDRPMLAGAGERQHLARDRHAAYFRERPRDSDLDYLLHCFAEAAALPGLAGLFDEAHNPLYRLPLSGDGAMTLLGFFQTIDPDTGSLVHDFTDPAWNTRFLGDLYQDLSEAARKRYALLQTPEFVERFILERTLDPAINTFGFREVRLIDPACGSGHFLLGAFDRLFALWSEKEPGLNPRAAAQRSLDAVAGVDINPFAAEIARFRLLLAALRASGIERLRAAPDFKIHVAIGDSLLHGRRFGRLDLGDDEIQRLRAHRYASEDNGTLSRILGRPYHAVVANPPYITPKDRAENQAYRALYTSCHRQYALAVPFTERCFDLAVDGRGNAPGGYVGLIVANSFMKREFGKKLIEEVLPNLDLTHVVDTAGAYIPGHGTPTVILFGRNRGPVERTVRTVMGIKGEPGTPENPTEGLVWSAIRSQLDIPGSESLFVSVGDTPRSTFGKHPWSMGGGGATDLLSVIEGKNALLKKRISSIGFYQDTHADEAFVLTNQFSDRYDLTDFTMPQVRGEDVRDWSYVSSERIIFPYDAELNQWASFPRSKNLCWFHALRTVLWSRSTFAGGNYRTSGRAWYDYHQFPKERARTPLSITFAFVVTHNHFVLDRGGKVFNRSAPVIKLPARATEADHLALLGLLNSSTACFWMKQTFHNKGSTVDQRGARQRTDAFEDFYEFTGTGLQSFPVAEPCPIDMSKVLDRLSQEMGDAMPTSVVARKLPTRERLDEAARQVAATRAQMIALQEELDWRCYRLYGLIDETLEHADPPPLTLGERAFEIVMARAMAAGELETSWFERHRSTPITEPPTHWPADYHELVERRISLIESHRWIGLVERPEYKRRWSMRPWAEQEREALETWLLDRLEDSRYWSGEPALVSTNRLADLARRDQEFLQVAELYAGRADYDLPALLRELVTGEAVPFLPVLRYTEAGLRKRAEWENCWRLQRQEDAIDVAVEAERPAFEAAARKTVRQEIERATRRSTGESDDAYDKRVESLVEAAAERIAMLTDSRIQQEQRRRKAAEVGDIPVPPKYRTPDFQKSGYWRLRGGLDVPKERFVSYPHCEREADGSPVVSWAGFDHLQEAQAIATYYLERKEREGWPIERLEPLLAGVIERLPWLMQWHNTYDSAYGMGMGDYFQSFVEEEARALGRTAEQLTAWQPPAGQAPRRGRRRKEAAR